MAEEIGGTGEGGLVVPGDLDDSLVDEAAALGNGEDASNEGPAVPAGRGNGEDRDWSEVDRHSDRVISVLGALWKDSEAKTESVLGKLLKKTEESLKASLGDVKLHVTGTVGMASREEVAAAWRGPAEAVRLLGGLLAGISERAGQDAFEHSELLTLLPTLKTAEELLQRASQHEEGKLPVIDEALGGTGTHGVRITVVCASVGEAAALVEKMVRGTETPSRKAVAVIIAGCIVELGGVFGAEGENSEFVKRVERLRQERAGPVEGAESNDVRAFRADFGKELTRVRKAMRWRERGIWAAGLAVCLLLGWAAGISGLEFSFVGRLL